MEKIKIIIADDNEDVSKVMKANLEKYEEIDILGTCVSDKEEIMMIDSLYPEIVITDLCRNNKLTGLEVIRKYKNREKSPKFLVVTACDNKVIDTEIMDGYINKPIKDYSLIVDQLKLIK
ncbi:MAG: response regulator [Clostridia bacterium]|nr:response regulator [Clostridia bacterium]